MIPMRMILDAMEKLDIAESELLTIHEGGQVDMRFDAFRATFGAEHGKRKPAGRYMHYKAECMGIEWTSCAPKAGGRDSEWEPCVIPGP